IAGEYFRTRIWAAPATLGLYAITGWYIGMQDAKTPMWISITVNLVNIGFSLLFIIVFDMKAKGVALGTVIGQYTGFVLALILLSKQSARIKKYWSLIKILNRKALALFMNVNKDILIRSVLLTGSFYYFNAKSASLGNEILAVNSILLQFLWIFSYFIDGFAFAAEALTGKYIGAKSQKNLTLAIRQLFIWATGISLFITFLYAIFNGGIISLLTSQTAVIELAQNYRAWVILLPVISFAAFVWDGIYIGATEGASLRNAMILSTILIFIPAIHLFTLWWENHGMWAALSLFMFSRGFLLLLYYPKNILTKISET
ncbi:MAG: MATE family efflux transporter, partial [Bacteroidota bacterium]